MNVLFVGSTEGTACSLYYFNALVRLGHRVLPWDPKFFSTDGLIQKLSVRMNKGPSPESCKKKAQTLIGLCTKNRFDWVLVLAENFFPRTAVETIKKLPHPPRFLYHSHDNNYVPGICKSKDFFETLSLFDAVFTTKSQNEARYRKDGIKGYYIPSAYEPLVHRVLTPEESRLGKDLFDVSFIGTYDHSRDQYVEKAGWERLWVWGNDWQRYSKFSDHRSHIAHRPLYYFEFADVLSHSKLSLGLLREEAEDRHTQRTFEIPACGALQLAPRNDEILSLFKEDSEILLFSSPEEMQAKIEFALKHPDKAKKIASAGYQRILKGRHTYQDRILEMESTLKHNA